MSPTELLELQRAHVRRGAMRDVAVRRRYLEQLRAVLKAGESRIREALAADLGKPELEVVTSETGMVMQEIRTQRKHAARWTQARRRAPSALLFPGRSRILREPWGSVLVMGPWNYPVQLALVPAVGALAAGNSVVVKPSEITANTASVLEELINASFAPEVLHVLTGGPDLAADLSATPFDYIFFTGSTGTGRKVAQAAAANLVPVTLELGGKCPVVVGPGVDPGLVARRLAFGKYLNAGQTCIAPDTALVHRSLAEALPEEMGKAITRFYGTDPQSSADYGRMVSDRHFDRISEMLEQGEVLIGGQQDRESRYVAPTVMSEPRPGSSLAEEEIFGPILPIRLWDTREELDQLLAGFGRPLAFYTFSRDRGLSEDLRLRYPAGAHVVNEVVSHITSPRLPFGGVGESGMGQYRGQFSIDTFTRPMTHFARGAGREIKFAYPPYGPRVKRLVSALFNR